MPCQEKCKVVEKKWEKEKRRREEEEKRRQTEAIPVPNWPVKVPEKVDK